MSDKEKIKILKSALNEAKNHLEFINYGDVFERKCAEENNLEQTLEKALKL